MYILSTYNFILVILANIKIITINYCSASKPNGRYIRIEIIFYKDIYLSDTDVQNRISIV